MKDEGPTVRASSAASSLMLHGSSHAAAGHDGGGGADDDDLGPVRAAGGQEHPLADLAAHPPRSEVGDDDDLAAGELFWLVDSAEAGADLAAVRGAVVKLENQE